MGFVICNFPTVVGIIKPMSKEKIFKKYDIRGVYPDEINEKDAQDIGRAFVSYLGEERPRVVVGRDGRESSPVLYKALKEGLKNAGAEVFDIGLSNTPLLNFAVCKYGYSGGVMVTASHNPPQFNGLKLIRQKGLQVYGEDIQRIRELVKEGTLKKEEGREKKEDPLPSYVSHILSFNEGIKDLKVVVDYGNGVASVTGKPTFKELNAEVTELYEEVRGDFPAHLPNPEPENMKELVERVKKENADVGIFFDGDGDRSFFVDEKGNIVYPDLLLSMIVKEELSRSRERDVYFDLRFSRVTEEVIKEAGGDPIMMKVGNPFYKEKLIKEGGLMGAELSGHIMHKDNFCIDDGLFMAIKVLNFLSKDERSFSELIKPLRKYYQSEEINIEVREKEKALERAKEAFKEGELLDIDGVYVRFNDWWFNIRKSNTEDLVRLRLEADTEELLENKKKELIETIKGADKRE